MDAHPHVSMAKEIFVNWIFHFVASVPGDILPESRHILILNGHGSHMAMETVEDSNHLAIYLLTLPSHTTRRLQLLHFSMFGLIKNYFRAERSLWMAKNLGMKVKIFELVGLARKEFKMTLRPSNIKSGFRRTRIWPLNFHALINDTSCSHAFLWKVRKHRSDMIMLMPKNMRIVRKMLLLLKV